MNEACDLSLRRLNTITLPLAMRAMRAALDEAGGLSVRVSVAIVDAAGGLIHLAHMDGAPLQCRDIAVNKALTAVGFAVSTGSWEIRLKEMSDAVRQGLPFQPRMALFGGGEPMLYEGVAVGGDRRFRRLRAGRHPLRAGGSTSHPRRAGGRGGRGRLSRAGRSFGEWRADGRMT
ncbi:heme-binding protein [Azotobacter vinelandii]